MKHLRPFGGEDRRRKDRVDPLADYAPVGTKGCEAMCDRDVIMTKDGPVVVCKGCKRIVMDNRDI